jgi:hypothetical protein
MPFELGDSIKNTCNLTFQSRGMNSLFCSKFYTTTIMTIMVIVLIMIIYPCKKNTPTWILFKLGFYVFIFTLGILIMHDGVVLSSLKEKIGGNESENFINNIHGDNIAFDKDSITVSPITISEYNDPPNDSDSTNPESNNNLFQHFGV